MLRFDRNLLILYSVTPTSYAHHAFSQQAKRTLLKYLMLICSYYIDMPYLTALINTWRHISVMIKVGTDHKIGVMFGN